MSRKTKLTRNSSHSTQTSNVTRRRQQHLALGQRNANFVICEQCGMVYTPQLKPDVYLHRRYHRALVSSISLRQAWKTPLDIEPKKTLVTTFATPPIPCLFGLVARPHSVGLILRTMKEYNISLPQRLGVYDKIWCLQQSNSEQPICFAWTVINQPFKPHGGSDDVHCMALSTTPLFYFANTVTALQHPDGCLEVTPTKPYHRRVPVCVFVKFIWVNPAHRRKGIATQMIRELRKKIPLTTQPYSHNVIAFGPPSNFQAAQFFSFSNSSDIPAVHSSSSITSQQTGNGGGALTTGPFFMVIDPIPKEIS